MLEVTTTDEETQQKWKFAEALLRFPNDPFHAARLIALGHTVEALRIMQRWHGLPEIFAMKAALIEEHGEEAFLPSEAAMVGEVMTRAHLTRDNDEYVKLMALAFDVRGMTSKAKSGPQVVVNNVDNRTMEIPILINNSGQPADIDDWERMTMVQQERLVTGNVS